MSEGKIINGLDAINSYVQDRLEGLGYNAVIREKGAKVLRLLPNNFIGTGTERHRQATDYAIPEESLNFITRKFGALLDRDITANQTSYSPNAVGFLLTRILAESKLPKSTPREETDDFDISLKSALDYEAQGFGEALAAAHHATQQSTAEKYVGKSGITAARR